MTVWQFLRIALCASPLLQPITTQAISYCSAFLPSLSSMARACPAVVEFTFKAKSVRAPQRAPVSAALVSSKYFRWKGSELLLVYSRVLQPL
jgi:hypothetical protein